MRDYHEYERRHIGGSDVAALVMAGCKQDSGITAEILKFGGDGEYKAYIVDAAAEVGAHYKKVAAFTSWLTIYDDEEKTAEFKGKEINVYRAAEYGCIIQIIE